MNKYGVEVIELSHSSNATLAECPRKYELKKLLDNREFYATIDTAFGKAVGQGIAAYLATKNIQRAYYAAFTNWDVPLEEEKRTKNFYAALFAIDTFAEAHGEMYKDYVLAEVNGKKAMELGIRIDIVPKNGLCNFKYISTRGYIDLVLVHKGSGQIKVVEVKTTASSVVAPSMYANSLQSVGYLLALEKAGLQEITQFTVDYLVCQANKKLPEWQIFPFLKGEEDKKRFLKHQVAKGKQIDLFTSLDYFPREDTACRKYGRDCEYFGGACNRKDLILGVEKREEKEEEWDVHVKWVEETGEWQVLKAANVGEVKDEIEKDYENSSCEGIALWGEWYG